MTLVLDSGGISGLLANRARLRELLDRGLWPAEVSAAVLVESLTGDHRRDFKAERLLSACQIRSIEAPLARDAARLRTTAGRAGTISAVDALVVAHASARPDAVILTSVPDDLTALAVYAATPVKVVAV